MFISCGSSLRLRAFAAVTAYGCGVLFGDGVRVLSVSLMPSSSSCVRPMMPGMCGGRIASATRSTPSRPAAAHVMSYVRDSTTAPPNMSGIVSPVGVAASSRNCMVSGVTTEIVAMVSGARKRDDCVPSLCFIGSSTAMIVSFATGRSRCCSGLVVVAPQGSATPVIRIKPVDPRADSYSFFAHAVCP